MAAEKRREKQKWVLYGPARTAIHGLKFRIKVKADLDWVVSTHVIPSHLCMRRSGVVDCSFPLFSI